MNRRLVVATALAVLAACSDPYSKTIPPASEFDKDASFKKAVEKLPSEEKQLLAGYVMRSELGGLFNKAAAPKQGVTVREAIDAQRQFLADEAKREAEAKALAEKAKSEREAQQKLMYEAATVAVTSVDYVPSDFPSGRISDALRIRMAIENRSPRTIKGLKGSVHFVDMFGDEIINSGVKLQETISPGKIVNWVGAIDYNQFMDSHRKLRETPFDKMKIRWDPEQIIWDDGTILKVPE